jgi:hypothetical protein
MLLFYIYFLLSAKQKKVTKKSSPLRKNLMKTTQNPTPDEKNSFAKANSNSFSSLDLRCLPACRQGRLVFY